jgi:hypothetical protein
MTAHTFIRVVGWSAVAVWLAWLTTNVALHLI